MITKNRIIAAAAALSILYSAVCATCIQAAGSDYGVYIGLDNYSIIQKKAQKKNLIVIEGQSLSKKEIEKLKIGGRMVYSYLNVGSVETYRPYYRDFEDITLDIYENWPDEKWVDVSKEKWQKFVVKRLAGDLVKKGVDGFFLDNCDVYYHYENKGVYSGLKKIMKGLRSYDKVQIINGGDVFVRKLITDKKTNLIDGVNQETVFSRIIDYDNDVFSTQPTSEHNYFQRYLKAVKKHNLSIYLLEYTKDKTLKKQIQAYCKKMKYGYYISEGVKLN